MFLEEEVYGMLFWGFAIVMIIQLVFFTALWLKQKFDYRSFIFLIMYLVLFSLAGINLLLAIQTNGHGTTMGSEEASINMAIAGGLWGLSVILLLMGVSRLVQSQNSH